uniref:Reverse transcriptase Ty1/copia-type domain-containing protein n=1 Tax=Tanacetum cinerariifolium TaxID=118510 RepID=A0A6L2NIT7_TANCI|nr:hypothetical protein [Tanacetum cinerariifolium]
MEREDTSQPPPPPIASTEAPQMVPSIKIPILKKGEYILWTMKMEQYLAHTNYALWEVILNGNSVIQMTKDKAGNEVKVPVVTAQQILARTRERKAKSTLPMAIPDEHLARFHRIKDAKTLSAAIKTIFGGNAKSKKMQKMYESNNLKFFLNKPGIDNLDIDDLYNNLKVYGAYIKGSSGLSSNSQNAIVLRHKMAMLSMRVKRFYKKTGRKMEFNGKEPVGFDKTKVESFNCHRRGHFARDCRSARNSGNWSRDAGNAGYRGRDNGKWPAKEEDEKALVVQDGLGTHDWSYQVEEEATDFGLLAFTSNPSSYSSSNSELDEALRETEDLKAKLEKFETSSKNLTNLLDRQISAKAKTGLGYDSQFYEKELLVVKEEEVTETMFDNRSSDEENSLANDRFKKVFTRSGRIPVSVAKPKVAASTSVSKPVNTTGPKQISVVKGNRVTVVKTSAGYVWRPRVKDIDQIYKDNRWIYTRVYYGHLHQALKNKGFIDNGCSRHMTENKAYLADYQEINDRGFVAFGSSRGNLVRGLPSKIFENDHTCIACQKGKQHKATYKAMLAEAVNTVCYVLNRDLVTKSHNKTPCELLNGIKPRLDFMRPFGYPVTILNTLDPLGKFEGKADEGFLVGYSVTSKAFRNQTDKNAGPQDTNGNASTQDNVDARNSEDKAAVDKPKDDTGSKTVEEPVHKEDQAYRDELDRLMSQKRRLVLQWMSLEMKDTTELRSTGIFTSVYGDDFDIFTSPVQSVGVEADFNNMEFSTFVSLNPTHRVHIDHPKDQILGDPKLAVQTKGMAKNTSGAHALVSYINKQRRTNHKDYENCLFSYFLLELEPKKVAQALDDESWVEAMQEELLQFSLQKFPNKVYKVEKALYGLHQAPKAWYETLSTFMLQNGYRRGTIDKTLFIKKDKDDNMLVQMSSMGELTFFLGLQVKQSEEGIFISQDKFHVTPKRSHLHTVKWIFRYLKGQPILGIWYPRDSPFNLEAYSDSDYAGANIDRKSTTEGCQFLAGD